LIDGLGRGGFGCFSASPSTRSEQQQLSAGVGRVRLPSDIAQRDELRDQLSRGLFRDSEVLCHVGRSRVTGADPYKCEPIRGANVSEPPTRQTFLHAIDELTGQSQDGPGGFPMLICHSYILTSLGQAACL
jgi:hypothetical protein